MTTRINRYLIEQTRFDSAELSQLGFVVHQYTRAGQHQVDIFRHDKLQASLIINVDAECSEKQLSIDLATLENTASAADCECKHGGNSYQLDKEGYVVFFVGSGSGGYSVKSYPVAAKETELLFDSRHLGKGDLFGITLLRPGQYRIEEPNRKIGAPLYVEPVKPGKDRYVPPDAVHLDLEQLKKATDGIRLQQAQGLVFRAEQDNRILIRLDDHDSQQNDKPQQVARWTKASARRR